MICTKIDFFTLYTNMGLPWLSKFIKDYKKILMELDILSHYILYPGHIVIDASGIMC